MQRSAHDVWQKHVCSTCTGLLVEPQLQMPWQACVSGVLADGQHACAECPVHDTNVTAISASWPRHPDSFDERAGHGSKHLMQLPLAFKTRALFARLLGAVVPRIRTCLLVCNLLLHAAQLSPQRLLPQLLVLQAAS